MQLGYRMFGFALAGLLVAVGLARLDAAESADRPTRLNVLFLAVDDLRPELGCYGASHIVSPRIDRLAASGVRFHRAYCQYPICGPSRASLLTGLRPDTLKIEDIDTYFRDTVPDVVTLPQHFRVHGYTTVYAGKVFHAGQTDDAHSWSRPAVRIAPRAGAVPGEYQLPESRVLVQSRRDAALARFGPETDLVGLACGPAVEAADAPDDAYRLTLWVDRRRPKTEPYAVELYDHVSDPHETVNVANRPEHHPTIAALRQMLQGQKGR